MPRKVKTTLTVLPKNPKRARKVPKPQVNKVAPTDQFSRQSVKSQIGINVPGVKTQ